MSSLVSLFFPSESREGLTNVEASLIVLFREIDLPLLLRNFAELREDLRETFLPLSVAWIAINQTLHGPSAIPCMSAPRPQGSLETNTSFQVSRAHVESSCLALKLEVS